MAKEKNLTAVTSVAAADFARVVTSAGASVKATFANVAKYIIETYNGSTVAGSAQSVKSALDSLNSNKSVAATYTTAAINKLKTDYSDYATGFSTHTIVSGGPVYLALAFKYSDAYGCAILMTYAPSTEAAPVFVQLSNGTWTSGIVLR